MAESEWRWRLQLARDARTDSARRRLATRAHQGELVRVSPGAYVLSSEWNGLDADERYIRRLQAIQATTDEPLVFSHLSAVAIWGLPAIRPWPPQAHIRSDRATGRRTGAQLRRHLEPPGEPVVIDGLFATTLARTVVDIARGPDLAQAVVVADAALNPATRRTLRRVEPVPDLEAELANVPARHGTARARHVLDFADERAESPGESLSRLTIDALGLPSPVLQQVFPRDHGRRWVVDFWWPEFGIIGEFDGAKKYVSPDVVLAEKHREDDLRRRVRGFARWGWREAQSPPVLAARLRAAGMPINPEGSSQGRATRI